MFYLPQRGVLHQNLFLLWGLPLLEKLQVLEDLLAAPLQGDPSPSQDIPPVVDMDTRTSYTSTTLDGGESDVSLDSIAKRSIHHVDTSPEDIPHMKKKNLDGGLDTGI